MGRISRNSYDDLAAENRSPAESAHDADKNPYGCEPNAPPQALAVRNSCGPSAQTEIRDALGRKFQTLRLSLTSHCNFACSYCVPASLSASKPKNRTAHMGHTRSLKKKAEILEPSDYAERVRRIHQTTPLQTVRLTGGEPLLYKKIEELICLLQEIGIPEIKLTTNAYFLEKKASSLKRAGLHSLNVSLDALTEKSFRRISPLGKLNAVLRGIEAALHAGLSLKLNATIMGGQNEDQILPLLEFAMERNLKIRFLEVMKMGHLAALHDSAFFSRAQILDTIASRYEIRRLPRSPGATANYWKLAGTPHVFGIIANHSDSFCRDCHRLRMDSSGNLYGCLSSPVGFRMPEKSEEKEETKLREILRRCLSQKRLSFSGSEISMKAIGG